MTWLVIFGFLIALGVLYAIYDKFIWYMAKREEAKRGAVTIAEHMELLRDLLSMSDSPERKALDDIYKSIQVENARMAYVIGGVKLLDKVSRAEPAQIKQETETLVKEESRKLHVV